MTFQNIARDNTYNSENDFSSEFTWSVWTADDHKHSDWLWSREPAYIAICKHMGGDVRGNYGAVRLYRVDECVGDSGFLDWVLGWHVQRLDLEGTEIDLEEVDAETLKTLKAQAVDDERLIEQCSPGWAPLPSSELYDECDTDRCYWLDGTAVMYADGHLLFATPYHYAEGSTEVAQTPEDGLGYTCDASIDVEAWLKAVLGSNLLDEYGLEVETDRHCWDHDERIGVLCDLLERLEDAPTPEQAEGIMAAVNQY